MAPQITAKALAAEHSSILAGYRTTDSGHAVLLVGTHVTAGEDHDDAALVQLTRELLDAGAQHLAAGAAPADVLLGLHTRARAAQRFFSAAVARMDGDTLTVARAGHVNVTTFGPQPAVLLAPELTRFEPLPQPVLYSALGAPNAQPPQQATATCQHAQITIGAQAPTGDSKQLAEASQDPTGRGGLIIDLHSRG